MTQSSGHSFSCLCIVGVRNNEPTSIGSGFLVRWLEKLFVVTAAHLPSNSHGFDDFSLWPPDVSIVPGPTGSVGLVELFSSQGPRFRYITNHEGRMLDVIAFEVPERRWGQRIYDLSGPDLCSENSKLAGYGFPEKGNKKQPYWPPDKIVGRYSHQVADHRLTTLPIRRGHSGGPVLMKGELIGMMIGNDAQFGTIIPKTVIQRLFAR